MIPGGKYSIVIRQTLSDDKAAYEATVKELPDVSAFGKSPAEAHKLAVAAIESLQRTFERKKRSFPQPAEERDVATGRVTLRMPKSLHSAIAMRAEFEGVSLNTFICSALSHYSGAGNIFQQTHQPSIYSHSTSASVPFFNWVGARAGSAFMEFQDSGLKGNIGPRLQRIFVTTTAPSSVGRSMAFQTYVGHRAFGKFSKVLSESMDTSETTSKD